jgi:hypothetical protein
MGFQLIQQAACNNVRRALFETAALHEEGCEGESGPCIHKNHVLAIEYYGAISTRQPNVEWISQYATAHLQSNREFHETENILGTYVGSLLSWEFAGQAFLFEAAASIPEAPTYVGLLILLPFIGILVAFLSITMSIHTLLQNARRRGIFLEVYKAKLRACQHLVGATAMPKWWEDLTLQANLALFGEIIALCLGFLFLIGWIFLLAPKFKSKKSEAFIWFPLFVWIFCLIGILTWGGTDAKLMPQLVARTWHSLVSTCHRGRNDAEQNPNQNANQNAAFAE